MIKYYIYYFVGGFVDAYQKKELKEKNQLFFEEERIYFSRFNDNRIERVYGPFTNEKDPLLEIVIALRKNYIMEVRTNENNY